MTSRVLAVAAMVAASIAVLAAAQPRTSPRMADGHPDMSGVYQADARARVGTWDEANKGIGVPEPAPRPSGAPPAGRGGPPYQPWAAKLVLDDFNNRNVDSATAQ